MDNIHPLSPPSIKLISRKHQTNEITFISPIKVQTYHPPHTYIKQLFQSLSSSSYQSTRSLLAYLCPPIHARHVSESSSSLCRRWYPNFTANHASSSSISHHLNHSPSNLCKGYLLLHYLVAGGVLQKRS